MPQVEVVALRTRNGSLCSEMSKGTRGWKESLVAFQSIINAQDFYQRQTVRLPRRLAWWKQNGGSKPHWSYIPLEISLPWFTKEKSSKRKKAQVGPTLSNHPELVLQYTMQGIFIKTSKLWKHFIRHMYALIESFVQISAHLFSRKINLNWKRASRASRDSGAFGFWIV